MVDLRKVSTRSPRRKKLCIFSTVNTFSNKKINTTRGHRCSVSACFCDVYYNFLYYESYIRPEIRNRRNEYRGSFTTQTKFARYYYYFEFCEVTSIDCQTCYVFERVYIVILLRFLSRSTSPPDVLFLYVENNFAFERRRRESS